MGRRREGQSFEKAVLGTYQKSTQPPPAASSSSEPPAASLPSPNASSTLEDLELSVLASTVRYDGQPPPSKKRKIGEEDQFFSELQKELMAKMIEASDTSPSPSTSTSSTPTYRPQNRVNVRAIEDASNIKKQLETLVKDKLQISETMEACEIQSRICEAEDFVSSARHAIPRIGRPEATANVIKEVNALLISIDEKCRSWRMKFPDNRPLQIDNRTALNNPFAKEHSSTLIAYCLALANRVFEAGSRRSAGVVLRLFKLFGMSLALIGRGGPTDEQRNAIDAIPDDIRTLERRLNLDVDTVTYAVCPSCSFTHPPIGHQAGKPRYPEKCTARPTAHDPPCDTILLKNNIPIKSFEYYPFFDWFGRFLAIPGVREFGDQFCEEVGNNSFEANDRTSSSSGRFFREFLGSDKKLFVADRRNEGRWFFAVFGDSFNIEGNRIGGKHSSTGIMAAYCLNLPDPMRNDPAYVYVPGIIQGPREPDATQSHHRHYLKPLVDDLLTSYTRGVTVYDYGSSTGGRSSEPYERTERVALATLHMDLKAARGFSGHVDVTSHCFCHLCQIWHKVNLLRTDFEEWQPVDDDHIRQGSLRWFQAEDSDRRKAIEKRFGTRVSGLHEFQYFRSYQITVDPMHTVYLRVCQGMWRGPLGLENPHSNLDNEDSQLSDIAFYYDFTPLPSLSSLADVDDVAEEDDNVLTVLHWEELPEDVHTWRSTLLDKTRLEIQDSEKLTAQVKGIYRLLSKSRPETASQRARLARKLGNRNWHPLLYVGCNLLALPKKHLTALHPIDKKDITKDAMAKALVAWRVSDVKEEEFEWPYFTTLSRGSPTTGNHLEMEVDSTEPLLEEQRTVRLNELNKGISYNTALGIGHIQRHLCQPIEDSEDGRERLVKKLRNRSMDSLLYVCVDLDLLSRKTEKKKMIDKLVEWRLQKPLDPLPWAAIDSRQLLERIHQSLHDVTLPTWTEKPPVNVGLPSAGTLKADNWRVLFEVHVPLALLSLWQPGSPIAAVNAAEMQGPLNTSMSLTCASLIMVKRNLTFHDRNQFRELWRQHILGLKECFPGFSLPVHHLGFHIYESMDLFGPVRNFWCFPGERLIRTVRGIPNNHKTGEFESTILHSYCRGSSLRQWLLRWDCPGLVRACIRLLTKVYGTWTTDGDSLDDGEANDKQQNAVPLAVTGLLGTLPDKIFRRTKAPVGDYTIYEENEGNSYVCFRPLGAPDSEWIAGRIECIVEEASQIKLIVRRCLGLTGHTGVDPFHQYWNQGFECKMVSSRFSPNLEVVNIEWALGHTARWQLSSTQAVVLRRTR